MGHFTDTARPNLRPLTVKVMVRSEGYTIEVSCQVNDVMDVSSLVAKLKSARLEAAVAQS